LTAAADALLTWASIGVPLPFILCCFAKGAGRRRIRTGCVGQRSPVCIGSGNKQVISSRVNTFYLFV
jgi:hypothetical protein